jgi:MFS family permease
MTTYEQKLEKNIGKYSWFKVFTKRVYLPLIAIQLVNVGKVTVEEIAIISVITSVFTVLLQLPTGYIADKLGNRFAILLGASISAVSPLLYILSPSFGGGLAASLLFFGGFAFQSGAIEAFMHDTLVVLGKEKEYSKVMGRAQSYGLIGNVVLITLVPATYAINQRLPFILGFVSLLMMVWLAASFTYPTDHNDKKTKNPFAAVRNIVTLQNIALFIFAGFTAGVANRASEYRELLFQEIGVAVALFGFLLAISSIVGAIMGRYVHILDKLKPMNFYLFDLSIMSICILLMGITSNPAIVVAGFTLFAGYIRVRQIIFQAKLLHEIKHAYKATLISALNLFSLIGEVAVIAILARLIGFSGYTLGYLLFGFAVFGIGIVLWALMLLEHKCRK